MTDPKEFTIYRRGVCFTSVCTSLCEDEAATRLNRECPTGIESDWSKSDKPFKTGEPNPCPCNNDPETHQHFLFVC